ncbi:hypothetical protein AEQ67_18850 [Pseudomonas sp. RIT-PI-q]|uniref:isocitrate lyase/PEP mutase family protein n=1 Tax=Pseudomonas sp. RIT-PI-q TaxID=1690247 RepID=UPI0006CC7CCC|nr:isocitrate lyase/PEP mutase family protein [Pseudomonas sp. RIT-PI-q]KPG95992.1 hypothetical protein AEQ67_18850 [Pseudomonas sp. RIT-PI-q]
MSKAAQLRSLLSGTDFIVAPGVHDAYSARIIEAAGFASACTSGAVLSQSLLGLPDLGILSLTENVDHCRRLARLIKIPVTADADAGYGNPNNVYHTIRSFEEAGLAGVNLEDQVVPRRWDAKIRGEVVSVAEMVRKVEAACAARKDADFVIIVRTDAHTALGQTQMVERIKSYVAAGADVILPMGLHSMDDVGYAVDAAGDVPVSISIGAYWRLDDSSLTESVAKLRSLGVRRITLPQMLAAASVKAMANAAIDMRLLSGNDLTGDFPSGMYASAGELMELVDADGAVSLENHLMHQVAR